MTKKQIKKLAIASYTIDTMDSKKVNRIVKLLNRKELKIYIKAIKNIESKKTLTLVSSTTNSELVKEVKTLFPDKRIVLKLDKSLIAGIKIIDNDDVYDFNIQNTLKNLVSYISR